MHEESGGLRLWPLECLRCWHVWEEAYVVRQGERGEVWLIGGLVVQPPWLGAVCPSCGGFAVTSFPDGYLSRHPELLSVPEPEPPQPPEPGPAPVPVVTRPRHHRLLVALGLPVLVATVYEIWHVATAVLPH